MKLFRYSLSIAIGMMILVAFSTCTKESMTDQSGINAAGNVDAMTKKKGPISVVYVEVNSNNLVNTGCYTLKIGGQQLFDIAIIFAANINYDVADKEAVLYNNPNVSLLLKDRLSYIKPLQDKGMKVLLSVLGNHEGAGISNFTSRTAAHDFAQQIADTVAFYNLDGVDFDDEYADYGVNGTPQPNDSSFMLLLEEVRSLMPNKTITFYYYGPATNKLTYRGQKAGEYLNYSWNAIYGTFNPPLVPGLAKRKEAAAAIWINNTSKSTAKSLAQQTKTNGYGAYLYYDLTNRECSQLSFRAFHSPYIMTVRTYKVVACRIGHHRC